MNEMLSTFSMLCASGSRISGARLRFSVSRRSSIIGLIWSFKLREEGVRRREGGVRRGGGKEGWSEEERGRRRGGREEGRSEGGGRCMNTIEDSLRTVRYVFWHRQ